MKSLPRVLLSLQLGCGERTQRATSAEEPPGWPGRKCTEDCPLSLPRRGVRTPTCTAGSPARPRAGCDPGPSPQAPPRWLPPKLLVSGLDVRAIRVTSWSRGTLHVSASTSGPRPTSPGGTQNPPTACRVQTLLHPQVVLLCRPRDPQSHLQPVRQGWSPGAHTSPRPRPLRGARAGRTG